jgi:hypothetical protein
MKFLNTIAGSWLKIFFVAILIKFMDMGADIFALNLDSLKAFVQAGVVACIPVIINFLNPHDTRYGAGKEQNKES